jgi:N-acetyl-D-muramate 6-phosphate phosphatase
VKLAARCVLFDLDGTLVDTAPDLGHAANQIRRSQNLPALPVEDYRHVASAGARGLLGVALGITPDHADFRRHRDAFLDSYRDNIARESRLFEGMEDFLRAVETRGLRWGVVTNKPGWLTTLLLDALKLTERAACALSPGDAFRAKPAPDLLHEACRRLALTPDDCVYVGDDKRDIDAGHAAGMRTIAAEWGYIGAEGPVRGWNATAIAATPADLSRLLLG